MCRQSGTLYVPQTYQYSKGKIGGSMRLLTEWKKTTELSHHSVHDCKQKEHSTLQAAVLLCLPTHPSTLSQTSQALSKALSKINCTHTLSRCCYGSGSWELPNLFKCRYASVPYLQLRMRERECVYLGNAHRNLYAHRWTSSDCADKEHEHLLVHYETDRQHTHTEHTHPSIEMICKSPPK